jgi:hypothetical protein
MRVRKIARERFHKSRANSTSFFNHLADNLFHHFTLYTLSRSPVYTLIIDREYIKSRFAAMIDNAV